MIKKQNYEAPKVEGVTIFPQEAVLDINSPTSYETLAIQQILGQGTGENDGVAW